MMHTHLSHFGLVKIGETNDSIIFAGSLAACRRMAFAHGMEVSRYEGRTIAIEGSRAFTTPADSGNFTWMHFQDGGFIVKGRDDYSLLIPQNVWQSS